MTARAARKVLYVIGSLEVGGTETHLLMVSRALAASGYDVSVFSLGGKGALGDAFEAAGVTVLGPEARPIRRQLWRRLASLAAASALLMRSIVQLRPDVVHFMLPAAYLMGAPLAILARRPVLVMSRRSMNVYQKRMPLLAAFERLLHRAMTMILANSNSVMRQLRDEEGVPAEKLQRIYNGVDLLRFLPVSGAAAGMRARLGIDDGALVMIIVANLIAYKGHADLLDALEMARPQLPDGWRLLIVGRDDGIGGALRAKAEALGLTPHLAFLGSRDDIPDLLRASDVGLLCSHQEGFSNAILEGMAAGLPMVVTNVGGNAEAVMDGETGLVVPAHRPDRLAEAIISLATSAERRESYGRAGRNRAEREFSNARCVEQYIELYERLIGARMMR